MAPKSLLNDAVANFVLRGLSVVAGFALTVTLAQILGAAEFGRYSIVIAVVTLLAIPAQLGIPELVLRETAKLDPVSNWGQMRGVWAWAARAAIASSLAIFLISLITMLAGHVQPGGFPYSTLLVALLFVPLSALGNIRGAILRGLGYVVPGLLPEYLIRPIGAVCAVLLLFYSSGELTADEAIYVYVGAAAFSFLVGALLLWRYQPRPTSEAASASVDSKIWRKSAVILALMAGMNVILQQADILLLGVFSTDHEIGIYRVAAQCSLMVSFGLTATLSAVAPHIARAHSAGDLNKVRQLVVYSARLTVLVAILPLLLILAAGEQFVSVLFGPEFTSAVTPLVILALSQAVVATVGPVSVLLVMTGYERKSAQIMVLTIALNILLNMWLIPQFGALGAAFGTGAAIVVQHILLSMAVRQKLGFFGAAFASAASIKSMRVK